MRVRFLSREQNLKLEIMEQLGEQIIEVKKVFLGDYKDSKIVVGIVKKVKITIMVDNQVIFKETNDYLPNQGLENAMTYLQDWLRSRITYHDKVKSQFNIRSNFSDFFSFRLKRWFKRFNFK